MGLRGVVSSIIALRHGVVATGYGGIDLQSGSLMTLFFLLSGFSLAIVYGPRRLRRICTNTVCGCQAMEEAPTIVYQDCVNHGDCQTFNLRRFYWKRFARVFPTYYLCTLVMVPLVFAGYSVRPSELPMTLAVSIIPVSTLLFPFSLFPLDDPAWFLCTIIWLWVMFPWWLSRAQRKADDQLVRNIVWWYGFQLFTIVVCYSLQANPLSQQTVAIVAKCHPLTRFPVFLMGVYAGLLCLRHPQGVLPWPATLLHFFPTFRTPNQSLGLDEEQKSSCLEEEGVALLHGLPASRTPNKLSGIKEETKSFTIDEEELDWGSKANYQVLQLPLLMLVVATTDYIARVSVGVASVGWGVWWSALVPFAQLEMVVALTRDGGKSTASRAPRAPLAQWLGRVNVALFLVHMPVRQYVIWATNGVVLSWPPDCDTFPRDSQEMAACQLERLTFFLQRFMKVWALPIFVVTSLAVAAVTFYCFERPVRRWLHKAGTR